MTPLVLVLVIAVGTYLIRVSFVLLFSTRNLPRWLADLLPLIAPAVLAALVAQGLVIDGAGIRPITSVWYLAAAIAAGVGWKTRSVGLTLAVGMSALWLATWILA